MDIDVVFADYSINDISKLSIAAEEIGFNCIWTSETKHNPFLPLSIASQNTNKIKLRIKLRKPWITFTQKQSEP